MGESTPKYSSDSFLPFPAHSGEINSRLTNGRHKSTSDSQSIRSLTIASVPWKTVECYSCGIIGLHEEINDFYEKMRPTEQEVEIRMRVVEHITRTVHSMWPHAKVEIFGSFRTGLYLPSSDIDMVVIGEWRSLPLSTLSEALKRNGIAEKDITVIANASVPIIRLQHTPSRIKVDISFNMRNGVESAKMVKNLMKEYPTLPKLVLVLKQFLVHRGLNEVYNGGMSSYCLTLLIVSLLQGYYKPTTLPSRNLGTLLLEFFEHYGVNFNYEKVSIHFEKGGAYQPKFRMTGTVLSVEDPLRKGNDVARGTYLMHLLKLAFENAFYVLHKAVTDSAATKTPLNSYLKLIIDVDSKVWNERYWMSQNSSSILSQLSHLMTNFENYGGPSTSCLISQQSTSSPSTSQRKVQKKKRIR